jgi:hypothetical protein
VREHTDRPLGLGFQLGASVCCLSCGALFRLRKRTIAFVAGDEKIGHVCKACHADLQTDASRGLAKAGQAGCGVTDG